MMNGKQIGLSVLLLGFLDLTAYAVYHHGIRGVFELLTANAVTLTAATDLVIALTMVTVWMWRDARDRGVSPVPYAILTLVMGSVGPLLYLIRRAGAEGMSRATVGAPAR
jgi:hypothetical protein